jgi:hypothetical protein
MNAVGEMESYKRTTSRERKRNGIGHKGRNHKDEENVSSPEQAANTNQYR